MNNKKTFQIMTHIMPWEIDYCLILFDTLSRSKKNTSHRYNIDVALNLSSYIINWKQSQLDKEFFIEKIQSYIKLLEGFDLVNLTVYDGDANYGHLDLQRDVIKPENDYYISITPDQLFDTSMLYYFEQSVLNITETNFLVTAEIPKFWDTSWDVISNSHFNYLPPDTKGYDFLSINRYDALNIPATLPINLIKLNQIKFAGWLDLYSKNFYENIAPVPSTWCGYGQWDLYAMTIAHHINQSNIPIEISQYKLENGVTISIEYSNWNYGENRSIYKSRLALNDIPDQREKFNLELNQVITKQIHEIYEEYQKQ